MNIMIMKSRQTIEEICRKTGKIIHHMYRITFSGELIITQSSISKWKTGNVNICSIKQFVK